MKNYILLDKDKIEKRIENLEQLKETSKNPQIISYFDGLVNSLKFLLEDGEDLKSLLQQAFEAGREFDSKDGVVDIQIVLNIGEHDISDLNPLYPNFEDWYNKQQEQ